MKNITKKTAVMSAVIAILLAVCIGLSVMLTVTHSGKINNSVMLDDGLVLTPTEQTSNVKLSAARSNSDGTYTVTATVTPSGATDKNLTWGIAWKDKDSEWANGKAVSEYITLTTSNLTATVKCNAPFGEQAILTAHITSDASVNATCRVDYKQKYFGTSTLLSTYGQGAADFSTVYNYPNKITVTLPQSLNDVYGRGSIAFYMSKFKPVMSEAYTVPLDASATFKYYVKVGEEFAKSIDMYNRQMSDCNLTYSSDWVEFTSGATDNVSSSSEIAFDNPDGYTNMYVSALFAKLCPEVEKSNGVFSDDQFPFFVNALNSIANNPNYTGTDKFQFYIKIEAMVGGNTYTDIHKVYINNYKVAATGLAFDTDSVEF